MRMKMLQKVAALSLLLLPTSLALLPARSQEASQPVRYICEGDKTFEAEYFSESVRLSHENQSLTLPQVPAASGIRYSNGTITLYSKGDEAFIEENGQTSYIGCVVQQSTSQQPAPIRALW